MVCYIIAIGFRYLIFSKVPAAFQKYEGKHMRTSEGKFKTITINQIFQAKKCFRADIYHVSTIVKCCACCGLNLKGLFKDYHEFFSIPYGGLMFDDSIFNRQSY